VANQRREYEDFEQISSGVKLFGWQLRAVHAAAAKAKVSTAMWLERVVMDQAVKELGTTLRELEPRDPKPGAAPVRTAKPENAAKAARLNAALLDAQAQLKQLTEAVQALSTAETTPGPIATRRRR
jgi:hypothetical protein